MLTRKFKFFAGFTLVLLAPLAMAGLPFLGSSSMPSLAPMLENATPTVVNISTKALSQGRENPLLSDPFFRRFFDLPDAPAERKSQSLGSGVIIDAAKGYVVTNHHVIDKADEITVTLRDGRHFTAELVGSDSETDVALIKIPPEKLTAIEQGDSDKLRVGDFVVAIGNPFGLGQTVTSGIVSALGRSGLGIEGYEDFIQTDASINPGNSGGALVDLNGGLIGINTAILAPNGGNVGIGFAIPINMVKQITEQLLRYGEVKRGALGVQAQDLTPELVSAFGLANAQGAVVTQVTPGSTAERAGLRTGDVVTHVNGKAAQNSAALRNQVGLLRVGEEVTLTVIRQGKTLEIKVQITQQGSADGTQISPYFEGASFGEAEIESVRGLLRRVMVSEIKPGSPAWNIGLRKGDIILSINQARVQSMEDLAKLAGGRTMALKLLRDGMSLTIVIR